MNIMFILFWASFLCLMISILTLTFPTIYPRVDVKIGSRRIQIVAIVVYAAICAVAIALNKLPSIQIPSIEVKIAIMIIPVVACILFSAFLYYPSARFLAQTNIEDQSTIDVLLTHMFKCSFSDKDGSKDALDDLSKYMSNNKEFIKQYGLFVYLTEYIDQAQYSITNKPAESIIQCVLDRCNQVKSNIDNYSPTPFPNIGLILSFVFSTVLTVLLSIVTVIPQ